MGPRENVGVMISKKSWSALQ